jgi:hypothetical protein
MLGSRAVTVDRARALLRLAHSDQESRVEAGLRGELSTINGRLGSDLERGVTQNSDSRCLFLSVYVANL